MRRMVVLGLVVGLLGSGCAYVGRVSVSTSGAQGNGVSDHAAISGDGHVVAFDSVASNLVPGDTNDDFDVFARDVTAGTTTRVSVSTSGAQSNGYSSGASVSGNGRLVAFDSAGTNLVPGDTNGGHDVFVRDLVAGTTKRVSESATGGQADRGADDPVIAAGGGFVAFVSNATDLVPGGGHLCGQSAFPCSDVYVKNLSTGGISRVDVSGSGQLSDDHSEAPSISADGRYVAFRSAASNLVPGDTNGYLDVFVRDRTAGTTTRVNVSSAGAQADFEDRSGGEPMISADGRYVVFVSWASNLVPGVTGGPERVYVRDLVAGTTTLAGRSSGGSSALDSYSPSISGDGRYVVFQSSSSDVVPDDTNHADDVYVRDLVANTTTRVSLDGMNREILLGLTWLPVISGDGRYVAFTSTSRAYASGDTNGVDDVFVKRATWPTVTSIAPSSATPGSTVELTVHGTGFIAPISAGVSPDVLVRSTTIVSETELKIVLDVAANAAPGTRDVTVFDPGTIGLATGSGGQCAGCLTVQSA